MAVEKGEPAVVQADALPYSVTQHEAAVEYTDLRIGTRKVIAIDIDDDRSVAIIGDVVVGALRHLSSSGL